MLRDGPSGVPALTAEARHRPRRQARLSGDDPALVEAPLAMKTRLLPRSLILKTKPPDEKRLRRHFNVHRSQATSSAVAFPIRRPLGAAKRASR
jgi:hypothetical protein